MRLLIRLRCTEDGPYEMQYHYHLQGFIYNLLKGSRYDYVHDKDGYKFFSFSNIFPANPLRRDDFRTLIISSPDSAFVSYLHDILLRPWNSAVSVGVMQFKIESVQKLTPVIPDGSPFSIITGTPIVVRIPKQKYQMYRDDFVPGKEYDYLYWRSEYPIGLFVAQLEDNLTKKYKDYCSLHRDQHRGNSFILPEPTSQRSSIFQKFKFKKQISTRLIMRETEQVIIGTVWEFMFEGWGDRGLIQFALDSGLGERNSLGFGFMNLIS